MLDWFFPQTLEIVDSKINGPLKIVKSFGRISLWVGGFEQSGVIVENLWKRGLAEIKFRPQKILILGLGAGTITGIISARWPKSKQTGVEIDPEMIRLGKKYFQLDSTSNLKVVVADAHEFIGGLKSENQKYDLIIVDLYLGGKIDTKRFNQLFTKIPKLLSKNGEVVFNALTFNKPRSKTDEDLAKLRRFLKIRKIIKLEFNSLVFMNKLND